MQGPLIHLWISDQELSRMVSDAGSHFPNETGGVLMGYWASNNVVVTDLIGGGPLARRTSTRFYPDSAYQVQAIEEIYNHSGAIRTYLGDWHTHPRGRLALSPTDRQTLRRIAKYPLARANSPIMMLLAGDQEWHAAAWCWCPKRKFWSRIQACALATYEA